jgi:CYTH domain-containing protein
MGGIAGDAPGERTRPSMDRSATLEIERKFLVVELPRDLAGLEAAVIEQGYLAIAPDGTEVRLRRKGDRFFQTVKSGRGLVRRETEVELSEAQFAALWPLTEGRRLTKRRYRLPLPGHICELDVFGAPLAGLVLAEVEFPSMAASRRFIPPAWCGAEVTGDRRFQNQHLALHGMPANFPRQDPGTS